MNKRLIWSRHPEEFHRFAHSNFVVENRERKWRKLDRNVTKSDHYERTRSKASSSYQLFPLLSPPPPTSPRCRSRADLDSGPDPTATCFDGQWVGRWSRVDDPSALNRVSKYLPIIHYRNDQKYVIIPKVTELTEPYP